MSNRGSKQSEAGFSLFEVLVVATFLSFAACAMAASLVHAMTVGAVNKETATAQAAARQIIEMVESVQPEYALSLFNAIDDDDPDGIGTAPGNLFSLAAADANPVTIEVVFPTDNNTGALREDGTDDELGLPCDLNGDGQVDNLDHRSDYVVLPYRVRVTWEGVAGRRTLNLCSLVYRN